MKMRASVTAAAVVAVLGMAARVWAAPGPQIEVKQLRPGVVSVRVATPAVTVEKTMEAGRSTTRFTAGGDTVSIVIDTAGVTIGHPDGEVKLDLLDEIAGAKEKARLDGSRALAAARKMLGELTLDARTLDGRSLMLTRALLGVFAGDVTAVSEYRRAAPAAVPSGAVRLAGFQRAEGPGKCWDIYSKYAIQIWDELIACKRDLHWYNVLSHWACDALYVEQSELAMAWLVACDGGLPVK